MAQYQLKEDLHSSKVIHLDSRFGTTFLQTGTDGKRLTTNYIYNLIEPLLVPDNQKILVSLYSATIPYSFYNLRTGVNDRFYVAYSTDGGSNYTDCYFDLTGGNYNAFELITEFNDQVATLGAIKRVSDDVADNTIRTQITFTWSYDRKKLKYNVYFTSTGSINAMKFSFNNTNQTVANMFGYYDGDDVLLSSASATPTQSTKCVDLNDAIHGLYIRQNISTKGTMDNENGTFSNILARIPITTNAGGVIFHKPNEATHHNLVGTNAIDNIGCKLTDDRNRPIDLNGLDWQVALLISFVENKPTQQEYVVRPNAVIPEPQVSDEPVDVVEESGKGAPKLVRQVAVRDKKKKGTKKKK